MKILLCVRQRTFSVEPFRYPLSERGNTVKESIQPGRLNQHAEGTSTSLAFAGQTAAGVLACWPQTVPVFMHYRLACVGCSLARFELITDVAAIYGIDPDRFLDELWQAIEGGNSLGEREEELRES